MIRTVLTAVGLYLAVIAAIVGVVAGATLLTGCAPQRQAASVNLLTFRDSEAFAICQAFAVRGVTPRLLTAAHCLRGAEPGASIAYATQEQWYGTAHSYSWAHVVQVDRGADRAVLAPESLDGLALLDVVAAVPDTVHATAPGWIDAPGAVREHVGQYYESTLDVRPGWSGAPVLDSLGRAVGIVVAYEADAETGAPVPRSGVFVGLP